MSTHQRLIEFLRNELAVSEEEIAIALKHPEYNRVPLHMILWQYGLVSIEQLGRIFDWLGDQSATPTLCPLAITIYQDIR